ncbi:MAG TPA: hypothetical protein VFU31_11815 [Candidatus Binatia bacterium]|nr:hypothetical protein [Candidatus Binatia bacterium]
MRNVDLNDKKAVMPIYPLLLSAGALMLFFSLAGCATIWEGLNGQENETRPAQSDRTEALLAQGNYEAAFKENQKIVAEGKGPRDVALFNMGRISAHSSNPRKDYARALRSFKKMVKLHPQSPLAEQARLWIQVLEEHQEVTEEKQKLAEEKRALGREREVVSQERDKLKYTAERSRQLDIEIEKRRRQTLSK